ncbi:MAG TPA: polysaccharide biosynthesis C-terminal domain-containing protein [Chitinophagaceae bacterium]|nr:polysaccharide biosynthesis C-terminal domain-containing protein [Chitinophagaceae bacterium]
MGVVFRQSIKTTIVTFLGAALGGILILISSNTMPEQELGFVRNLPIQGALASFFLTAGMGNTLFYYLHRYDHQQDHERKSVLLSLCFLVPVLLFFLAAIPYFLLQDVWMGYFQKKDIALLRRYIVCFPLFTLFSIVIVCLEAFLNAHIKTAQVGFVREVFIKGSNLVLFLLFGFSLINFNVFVYAYVAVNLMALCILYFMVGKLPDFRFSFNWGLLSRREYREIFTFSGFHALVSVSTLLIGFLDTQMLLGLDENGLNAIPVYTNAVYIATLISIPYRAMTAPAATDLSKAYVQQLHDKVTDSYSRSGINIFIASVFMYVLILCNLHNAAAILPKMQGDIIILTLIMISGRLIDCSTGLNDIALNMSPYYKFNFYLSLGLVALMFVAFWLLIPPFGVYGAAFVYSGSLLVFNVVKTYLVWTKMRLHPFSKGTLTTLLIGAAVAVPVLLLPHSGNTYWDVVWRSTLITIGFAGLVLWLKPSKDVSHYVNEVLKKKKLF